MKYEAKVTVYAEAGSHITRKTKGKIYELKPVRDCGYLYINDEGCTTFINERFVECFFEKLEEEK